MRDVDIGTTVEDIDVERAVRAALRERVPWYLGKLDERRGRAAGTTTPPRTWSVASENARWDEETPPALVVWTPGPEATPPHGRRATHGGLYPVFVVVTVGGATEEGTRALGARHAAAVRAALAHGHVPIEDQTATATWLRSATDVLPRNRKLMACEVAFSLLVPHVLDTRGLTLPATWPTDPTDPGEPGPAPTTDPPYRIDVRPT